MQTTGGDCGGGADPNAAIQACTRIINTGGQTSENLAFAYASRGAAYTTRATMIAPSPTSTGPSSSSRTMPEAYVRPRLGLQRKGDYDRAIADYDRAIQLKPDYAEAYVNRGWAYNAKGDYDRAIADFDRAIQLKPDYASHTTSAAWPTTTRATTTAPSPTSTGPSSSSRTSADAYANRGCGL